MELTSLKNVFTEELKDIYSAESQILKALPKMAKKAKSASLKTAFQDHLKQTEEHVSRLDRIAKILGMKLTGKKCKAMEGLIEEAKETLEAEGEDALIDTCLIAAAQRVEHYEMAAYGTVRAMAEHLGHDEIVEILQVTLDEETEADEKLSMISEEEILPEALEASDDSNDADSDSEEEEEDDDDVSASAESGDDDEEEVRPASKRTGNQKRR